MSFGQTVQKNILKASQLLKKLYVRHMVRKYVREVTPQRKAQVLVQEAENLTMFKFEMNIIHPWNCCPFS